MDTLNLNSSDFVTLDIESMCLVRYSTDAHKSLAIFDWRISLSGVHDAFTPSDNLFLSTSVVLDFIAAIREALFLLQFNLADALSSVFLPA